MNVDIKELLDSKRDLSEEEFNKNPELKHLVDGLGFKEIRGKIFIADGWYILSQVALGSRLGDRYLPDPEYFTINFINYIKNATTKILFDKCPLNYSIIADTSIEINTDIIFNDCIENNDVNIIHGYIFKKGIYLNNSNINFTDCTFEDNFKCENVNFDVNFSQNRFLKNFVFSTQQSHIINFECAQFHANAFFKSTQKIENANFYKAKFKNNASFVGLQFGDTIADFSEVEFDKDVSFYRCTFNCETKFNSTVFGGITKFTGVRFNDVVNLDKAIFKGKAQFRGTKFNRAILTETNFENKADFSNAEFNDKAYFTNAIFEADTDFSSATFADEARFLNANFKDTTTFENAEFKSEANFTDAVFEKEAKLNNILFNDKVYFQNAVFKDIVDFGETNFEKSAYFYNADFKNLTNFASSVFDGTLNFTNVKTNFTYLTYEELKNIIKDKSTNDMYLKNHKINHIDKCINITNDFRDGFRLIKHTLNDKGNALDASLYRCLELYCKELELEFTLENTETKNKEVKSLDKVEAKPKSKSSIEFFLDLITLKLYRNTSDHHTNLLQIINFMVLTITVYGFSLYAYKNCILTWLLDYSYEWVCLILLLVLLWALFTTCRETSKYSISWKKVLIWFIELVLISALIVYLVSINYIAYIALFITSYLLIYRRIVIVASKYSLSYLIYYSLFIVILFAKPFLIAPFIGVFTSEQAVESKFKEYTIRYNENGLDAMLLDANLTNTKKDNKLDFIVENRKTILEELDCDKTLLIKSKNKCAKYINEITDRNASGNNTQEAPEKPYAKALNALKYDEIMQSTQKSANLLYGFIMLLVVYSLTKTARKNSVVPS